jgi:hypothetical protein
MPNSARVAAFRGVSADSMGRSGLLPIHDKPGNLNTKSVPRCFFATKSRIFGADWALATTHRAAVARLTETTLKSTAIVATGNSVSTRSGSFAAMPLRKRTAGLSTSARAASVLRLPSPQLSLFGPQSCRASSARVWRSSGIAPLAKRPPRPLLFANLRRVN